MNDADHSLEARPIKNSEDRKLTKNDLRYTQAATDSLMLLHMKIYGEDIMSLHRPKEWAMLEETFTASRKSSG